MTGGRSIGASLIITRHFDRQVLNLPVFYTFYQLKTGNYRLTETLNYISLYIERLLLFHVKNVLGKM